MRSVIRVIILIPIRYHMTAVIIEIISLTQISTLPS